MGGGGNFPGKITHVVFEKIIKSGLADFIAQRKEKQRPTPVNNRAVFRANVGCHRPAHRDFLLLHAGPAAFERSAVAITARSAVTIVKILPGGKLRQRLIQPGLVKLVIAYQVVKPLVANLMRRTRSALSPSWSIDRTHWILRTGTGLAVKLTHSEAVLMLRMADQPGQVVPRQELVLSLGHDPQNYDFRRMEILVRRLRNKVKTDLGCELPLETVRKVGYAFTAALQVDTSR